MKRIKNKAEDKKSICAVDCVKIKKQNEAYSYPKALEYKLQHFEHDPYCLVGLQFHQNEEQEWVNCKSKSHIGIDVQPLLIVEIEQNNAIFFDGWWCVSWSQT